jgi:hypothetical protein
VVEVFRQVVRLLTGIDGFGDYSVRGIIRSDGFSSAERLPIVTMHCHAGC